MSEHTWATLADGTPLVTAERRGKGLIVLFHVTADTRWSDLPLSGAFVDMLKRIVAQAGTAAVAEGAAASGRDTQEVVPPSHILDGFGVFVPPPPSARPVPAGFTGRATPDHPPGFYGPPEGLLAVNTLAPADQLAPLDVSALNARVEELPPERAARPARTDPAGRARAARARRAGGVLARRRAQADAAAAAARGGGRHRGAWRCSAPRCSPARRRRRKRSKDAADDAPWKAALETRLAYVVTGNEEVDRISKAGLQGLTLFLAQRTALEAAEPIGLDPARDELAFYPLIYWPIVPSARQAFARGARSASTPT